MEKYLLKMLSHEQQKLLRMMKNMHKGYMMMLVNFGLCLVLLCFLMGELPGACLLAAFLISWTTAVKGSQITTRRMLFSVASVAALVVAGTVFEASDQEQVTDQKVQVSYLF